MKQHIYPLLASQRRRLGMSQQELAARAGLRREKVNRVESKGESISFDELCRLLDAVGLEFAVREKDLDLPSAPAAESLSNAARNLHPQEFHRASFIDGSRAKIVNWGKLPR
jgi:transcriptional regulator with XRE-family HTH domain